MHQRLRTRDIVLIIDVLAFLVIGSVVVTRSWEFRIGSVLIVGVLFIVQTPFMVVGAINSIRDRKARAAFFYALHVFASWLMWLFLDSNDFLRLIPGHLE